MQAPGFLPWEPVYFKLMLLLLGLWRRAGVHERGFAATMISSGNLHRPRGGDSANQRLRHGVDVDRFAA